MKHFSALLLLLAGCAGAAAQSTPIPSLPSIAVPADNDLLIIEHVLGPPGQKTSRILASDFANYLFSKQPVQPNGLAIGSVSTLPAGSSATATIAGNPPGQTLFLGIPKGADGTGNVNAALPATDGAIVKFSGTAGVIAPLGGPVTVAQGGTGAASASTGLANLGGVTAAQAAAAAPVQSVAGRTGAVTLANADVSGSAKSGINTDITSLASPALGAATATTQAASDNSTKVANTAQVQSAIALMAGGGAPAMQGRLTLTSGTPVLSSTVSAATTVYYTPYTGNSVALWNGSAFVSTTFAETSQALSDATKSPSAAVAGNVYDLFAWSDGGTIRVTRGPAWSAGTGGSNTVQGTGAGGTALIRVNGILVNAVAITNGPATGYGTYVGTIATDAGGATVSMNFGGSAAGGSPAFLNVWNAYNRVPVNARVNDSTSSWSYSSATIRPADNSTSNRIAFVYGLAEEPVSASNSFRASLSVSSASVLVGIGFNSTTTMSSNSTVSIAYANTSTQIVTSTAFYAGPPALGANYLQALEGADGANSTSFLGGMYQALAAQVRM